MQILVLAHRIPWFVECQTTLHWPPPSETKACPVPIATFWFHFALDDFPFELPI